MEESDIRNYLRSDTVDWGIREPVATRAYEEMWDTYLGSGIRNQNHNLMILAPRRSGKTFALWNKFLSTPNSIFVTHDLSSASRFRSICSVISNRIIDPINDILPAHEDFMHGRSENYVFFDEICSYRCDVEEMLRRTHPVVTSRRNGGMFAASTPKFDRITIPWDLFFNVISLPYDYLAMMSQHRIYNEEHFPPELFEL